MHLSEMVSVVDGEVQVLIVPKVIQEFDNAAVGVPEADFS